jgi:hypothetical protein
MTAITFEDPVDIVYTLLNTTHTWSTETYGTKPQFIKERDKGISRPTVNQLPGTGVVYVSELSYTRARSDAFYNSEDVTMGVSLKVFVAGADSTAQARIKTIFGGIEECRRTYKCGQTTHHNWNFLRQSKLMEFMDGITRIFDYELILYKQNIVL